MSSDHDFQFIRVKGFLFEPWFIGGWKDLPMYMTLVKTERARTKDTLKWLKDLPENYNPNLRIYYVANVFGEWDNCVWFDANNHDYAMEFVQNNIAKIPGIVHTYTLPTTAINNYFKRQK